MALATAYPGTARARDTFVRERRGARPVHDPWRHQGVLVEDERAIDGHVTRTATVFLTGRECPWRCVMCDLWQYTTTTDTPAGAIAHQVRQAIDHLDATGDRPAVLKLYNAGSFFDPHAVPEADYDAIAEAVRGFGRVIVESHPRLVGERLERLRAACRRAAGDGPAPAIEVAMGLETAHPQALDALHKGVTLDQFAQAAATVRASGTDLRVFVLVGVPFIAAEAQAEWVRRSVQAALTYGAAVVSLIPTRAGNGAIDSLEAMGAWVPPTLTDLEAALDTCMPLGRASSTPGVFEARVCADLWNVDHLATCDACRPARRARLVAMNLQQRVLPRVACVACGTGAA